MEKIKFTSDKYTKGRGSFSKRVFVKCVNCSEVIFNYQKEGNGAIEKLFFDKILDNFGVKKESKLVCPKCEKILGSRFVFGKDKKQAFKVYPGAIYYRILVPERTVFKRGGNLIK
ncbi:MAG: hypothetical protein WC069_02790 [Candidatus Shapirobacteria bacterium]